MKLAKPAFPAGATAARMAFAILLSACAALAAPRSATAQDKAEPLTALPSLNVPTYMGTWYQVAWFPNRFQQQCISDTRATYRQLPTGEVEVTNECTTADGGTETVLGLARPTQKAALQGDQLAPAQLEVSFMPSFLRWLPLWGAYWVIDLADDGRYAVVSEPKRKYLWVLSRSPSLSDADQSAIRSRLQAAGFDLSQWQGHAHQQPPSAPSDPTTATPPG